MAADFGDKQSPNTATRRHRSSVLIVVARHRSSRHRRALSSIDKRRRQLPAAKPAARDRIVQQPKRQNSGGL